MRANIGIAIIILSIMVMSKVHFSATSEHDEALRSVDRTSPNLPYISPMALGPAACFHTTVGKLGQTSLGSTPTSSTLNLFQVIWGGSNHH